MSKGSKKYALRGAVETIARCRPALYIEDDRKDKSAALHAFIDSIGYSITPHLPALFRAQNHFGKTENIWDQNFVSRNIVCLPR